jgi:hypothetical protein
MSFEHVVIHLLNGISWKRDARPAGRDLVLGSVRTQQGREQEIFLPEAMRPQHVAIMGLSGVGKTYFMESLIRQDIAQETGCVVFDVHGDLAEAVLGHLAEAGRDRPRIRDRVVIVEPFDAAFSIGFNPLETHPDTSPHLQAQELAHILRTRWETKSFGARTEELLRNSLYTLSAHGLTLMELPPLLSNDAFRARLLKSLTERAASSYWRDRYARMSAGMKAVVREPLLTRISAFLADPQVRDVVGQRKSTFSFREAMRMGQFVIINLSKGRLGENSSVLGSLLFTKLALEVMARSRLPDAERKLFTVYADELQNLAGRNFATLIAEARKYRVGIVAGHQFWHQLSPEMRGAMLGVGSRVLFRLHYHDARELAGEVEPREQKWYAEFLTRLARGEAVFRSGEAAPVSFHVPAHPTPDCSAADLEALRARSHALYAARRVVVGKDIEKRYQAQVGAKVKHFVPRGMVRTPHDGAQEGTP